jgi:hypothetical protein
MQASSRVCFSSRRASRLLVAVGAAALSFCAAVAASPRIGPLSDPAPRPVPAALGEAATSLQPLGRGPVLKVGRAFDPEDEDCILAVTQVEGNDGQVSVTRGVACAE